MNNSEIIEFAKEFSNYLMSNFGYNKPPARIGSFGNTIEARRNKFEFYLRYKPVPYFWPKNCLVIARIEFKKIRSGHGKRFLEFLISVSEKYTFQHIGIEQVNKNSESFGFKFGFMKMPEGECLVTDVLSLKRLLNCDESPSPNKHCRGKAVECDVMS